MDDGYLSRAEIFDLRLNADWVILSACNTASGRTLEAEGLSGLAQAFFYAGARALLVSHWYVDSDAALLLTTSTFRTLQKEPRIGRAEALRRAMIELIDHPSMQYASPEFWAPFVVIGAAGNE